MLGIGEVFILTRDLCLILLQLAFSLSLQSFYDYFKADGILIVYNFATKPHFENSGTIPLSLLVSFKYYNITTDRCQTWVRLNAAVVQFNYHEEEEAVFQNKMLCHKD